MNDEKKDLEEMLDSLLPEEKKSIEWIIDNIDFAMEMCSGTEYTPAEVDEKIAEFTKREDYFTVTLLKLKKYLDEQKRH